MNREVEIYDSRKVVLGGVVQTILLEGKERTLPVMIMLHGGPWRPVVYGEAYRGYYPELRENYILVWWDQYGCGKNYSKNLPVDLTVETFGKMTIDLIDVVKEMFPHNPIIINGYSFGSYLSMYAMSKRKDIVRGVINLGPIMNMREATQNFESICRKYASKKELRQMEEYRKKEPIQFLLFVGIKLAEKYTNCARYKGKEAHDSMIFKWILRLFTSHDYGFFDTLGVVRAATTAGKSCFSLWNSLTEIDITKITEEAACPVLYIQGCEELYILPEHLEEIVSRHDNMEYEKLPHCGHIPTKEAWPVVIQKIIEFKARI